MKFSLLVAVLFVSLQGFSQDIIQFHNGKIVNAKVIEVSEKTISYQLKSADGNGPIYNVSLGKVKQVQYENGIIDDFEVITSEFADLNRSHLLEFNVVDLAFERVSFNYEYFPSEKRDWSLFVPVRWTFNPQISHWAQRPVIETGLGASLYIVRKNKLNFSMGLESSYSFSRHIETIEQGGFWQQVEVNRHWMGFYANTHLKFNFKPRLGMNVGFAAGWKYDLAGSGSRTQAKGDIGVFYRF
jgi:hypothetical protein